MAQKHLKELLKEDQEPFHLKDYIADRQCHLKKQPPKAQTQLRKPKPISKNIQFPTNLCKNACFYSFKSSPNNLTKSPLFDFSSPVSKSPNRVFLHVPAKTTSLLLEAAMRIQKPKTQITNSGFRVFGSVLKRLTRYGNRTQKIKTEEGLILMGSSSSSSSSSCYCNGRLSSLDLESSSSGRSSDDDDGFEFANVVRENVNGDFDFPPCLSPLSPFRFALLKSPSPDRHKIEDNMNYYEQEDPVKFQIEEDEEDKEQNSPVSVLDRPFEDDYDGQEELDGYDHKECRYSFVQRSKQHLFHKLHKFEKLAELDPIELEKRMVEHDDKNDEEYDYESFAFDEQRQADEFVENVIRKLGFQDIKKPGIRRLVSDLLIEEERMENGIMKSDDQQVITMVSKRLGSWKEVESNTIDMMVEMDLRREVGEWKKPREQIGEVVTDIEVAIFAILVEELLEEFGFPYLI